MSRIENNEFTKAAAAKLFENPKSAIKPDNVFPATTCKRVLKMAYIANGGTVEGTKLIDKMTRAEIEQTRKDWNAPHVIHPEQRRKPTFSDPLSNALINKVLEPKIRARQEEIARDQRGEDPA